MKNRWMVLCIIASGLLTGCSLFSPVHTESSTRFLIHGIPCHVLRAPMRQVSLLVLPPLTDPVYDTTQMAYTTQLHQVAYFAKSSWAATPSQMLQPLLVQALQDTHHFRTVSGMSGWYSDYAVASQILLLQQDFTVCPARFRIVMRIQLVNSATNTVKTTKLFTVTEPMRRNNPSAGVDAANRAAAALLGRVAAFCVRHI